MIFHKLGVIFIHSERTGGVALRKHLLQFETDFERLATTKHLTAKDTKQKVGSILWDKYLTVGFIRNPFERLVSWYCACKEHIGEWSDPLALHIQSKKSFHELIYDPHPKILIPQYEKVEGVMFLGRFENYQEDIKQLCSLLDIPYKDKKENASHHKDYKLYYDSDTRKIVEEWYKEDLKKFGYKF